MRTTAATRLAWRPDPDELAAIAHTYYVLGWNPLPLPDGQKYPPPSGYTGEDRTEVTHPQITEWDWSGNIAVAMPRNVIGIDVDAYHGGTDTFIRLTEKYGPVPDAPYSTSRTDGSGIRFYQVPWDTKLVGKITGGIEVVQWFHRYALAWPSLHPETQRNYPWHGDFQSTARAVKVPSTLDLPHLPEAWLDGLKASRTRRTGHGYEGTASEWFDSLPKGILAVPVKLEVKRTIKELSTEGGRYDTMVKMLARLVGMGASGQPVAKAIDELFTAYVAAVDGETGRHPESEFDRAFEGAISKFGAR